MNKVEFENEYYFNNQWCSLHIEIDARISIIEKFRRSDGEMTENEAIEVIKSNQPTSGYVLFNEALGIAINALRKQIPKKPHKNFEKFSGVWCSCGKYFGKGYFVDKASYCTNCGQKLDWSDKE